MELKRKFEKEFPYRYFLRHRIYENPNEQLDNNILQYYIEQNQARDLSSIDLSSFFTRGCSCKEIVERERERIFYAKLSESRSGEKVRFNNNELWRDKKMVALVGKWNNTTGINYTQLRCIQWIAITCSPLRKSDRGNASLHKFACLRIQLFLSKILFLSFF